MHPLDDFTKTSDTLSTLLAQVRETDLGRPTPCAGWDVRALLGHIVDNTAFFAGAAGVAGTAHPPITEANAGAEFAAVAADVLGGFGAPGALERPIDTPYGTFPGATVLAVAVADLATHCWDLGRALGVPVALDAGVSEAALAAWRVFIVADYRHNGMFGPVQPCPADAPALDRVAAFAGRAVAA